MFAVIETSGATHIVINVPLTGADKSLPALAAMLEQNAVFLQKSWGTSALVKPKMSIVLGDQVEFQDDKEVLVVRGVGTSPTLDETFQLASAELFVSNAKALKVLEVKVQELGVRLTHTQQMLKEAEQMLKEAEEGSSLSGFRGV